MAEKISETKLLRLLATNQKVKVIRNQSINRECDECCKSFALREIIVRVAFAGKIDSGTPPELRYFHKDCYQRLYNHSPI